MSESTIPAEADARAEQLRLVEALLFAAACRSTRTASPPVCRKVPMW